jgi:hypothetical protein
MLATLTAAWDSSPFWTQAEAIGYLNHALRWWNLLTGYWKRTVLIDLAAPANPFVALPGSLVFGMEITWGATGKPLFPTALWDLDQGKPRWEEQTIADGAPVPSSVKLWAPVGLKEIAIWPAAASGQLIVNGVAATPILSALGDYVDLGDLETINIVHFALHIGTFKRGLASYQSTMPFFQHFLDAARKQNTRLTYSALYRKTLGLDLQKSLDPIVDTGLAAGGGTGAERGQA